MATRTADTALLDAIAAEPLRDRYLAVRGFSRELARPLSPEDCQLQSMPDASPTKWHLAHTTWFFESFVLAAAEPGYRPFDPEFAYLFNSYYVQVGPRHERPKRGLVSRPGLERVLAYREHVDVGLAALLERGVDGEVAARVELGLQHEQQHQELILTDIKHAFGSSPLRPAYAPAASPAIPTQRPAGAAAEPAGLGWVAFPEALVEIGHAGPGFAFDNETPRHRVHLAPYRLADRPVTNAELLQFMTSGGYETPQLWLSDGWATVQREGWRAPLYWEEREGAWHQHTLSGLREVDPREPVCHVSYYEADAFARWAAARLPTEAEWEAAASRLPIAGNLVESRRFHPAPAPAGQGLRQVWGDVWEWTGSAYLPYPGFKPLPGALGEYNGKFMVNQMVLRGGSCATPGSHLRPSYRNFFYPDARWQLSGIRLAADG